MKAFAVAAVLAVLSGSALAAVGEVPGELAAAIVTLPTGETLVVTTVTFRVPVVGSEPGAGYSFVESLPVGARIGPLNVTARTDDGSKELPVQITVSVPKSAYADSVIGVSGFLLLPVSDIGVETCAFAVQVGLAAETGLVTDFVARPRSVPPATRLRIWQPDIIVAAVAFALLIAVVVLLVLVLVGLHRLGRDLPRHTSEREGPAPVPDRVEWATVAASPKEDMKEDIRRLRELIESTLTNISAVIARQPAEVGREVERLLSERDERDLAAQRAAGLNGYTRVLEDMAERNPVLGVAERTRALVEQVKPGTATQAELKRKYAAYIEVAQMAERARTRLAGLKAARDLPAWDSERGMAEVDIERLKVKVDELTNSHRLVAFCRLLDESDLPELKEQRTELMRLLGLEEMRPRPGDAVTDTSQLELASVSGEGTRLFISRLVAPGYRQAGQAEWLQKPRVAVEQRA